MSEEQCLFTVGDDTVECQEDKRTGFKSKFGTPIEKSALPKINESRDTVTEPEETGLVTIMGNLIFRARKSMSKHHVIPSPDS